VTARLLLVDDDATFRRTLAGELEARGFRVSTAATAEEALERLDSMEPDVVVTDLRLPGRDGIAVVRAVTCGAPPGATPDATTPFSPDRTDGGTPVVVITGHEDLESAMEAMRAGAADYLTKPLDVEHLAGLLRRCVEGGRARRARSEADEGQPRLVGRSPAMIEIFKAVGMLARGRAPVLLRGETGTGKSQVARLIHQSSAYGDEPFVVVNCSALTETLLASELFGHVKGAFTGATAHRRGRFELAGRGTILLDEIGDTGPSFQTMLLRVLEDDEYYPVGAERPRRTEARVIAATHRPLEDRVAAGEFREDLYYRLRVVELEIPPLRQRPEDIAPIAARILDRIGRATGRPRPRLANGTLPSLQAYEWPGNVRELENALLRAAAMNRTGLIQIEDLALGGALRDPGGAADNDPRLERAIARHVRTVLDGCGGNKRMTARVLGISRSRLDRLISRHGLGTGQASSDEEPAPEDPGSGPPPEDPGS
jgi:two-component system response regulator AtoC